MDRPYCCSCRRPDDGTLRESFDGYICASCDHFEIWQAIEAMSLPDEPEFTLDEVAV